MIQMPLGVFELPRLKGEFTIAPKPKQNWEDWFSKDYQKAYEQYFNDHLWYRNFLVRLYNQINFSLFSKVKRETAILGKQNVLYDERYIKTVMGSDFVGSKEISETLNKLEKISNYLAQKGKRILVVIAPNKARYYPENIPDRYQIEDTTNYDIYKKEFPYRNINLIDFNAYFVAQKTKVDYDLIPKYGIHWSVYGAFLAADSIIEYCNRNFNYSLPKYQLDSITYTTNPSSEDYDMGEVLNILTHLGEETYLYPHFSVNQTENSSKKKVLVVSDSFFNNLYYTGFAKDIFNLSGYWYYNRDNRGSKINRKEVDFDKTLEETDLIILMQTEWNLYRLGFGLIDELNSWIDRKDSYKLELNRKIQKIKNDKEWFNKVKKEAQKRGISIDSMLIKSAQYVLKKKSER